MHGPSALIDAETLEREAREIARLKALLTQRKNLLWEEGLHAGDHERIDRCRRLHGFVKEFWSVLEPATPLVDGWPLEAMCLHLEAVTTGDITKLLINVPPGSMKSMLCNVFWPAWEWGPMGLGHMRYLNFSYSSTLTERDNAKTRDLMQSEKYKRLFGNKFSLVKIGEVKLTNDKTGFKLATSVGGVGTGERGQRVILDDPHPIKDKESPKKRWNTTDWFQTSMLNRLNDMDTSAIVVIMQRVHEADVSGVILKNKMPFVHLNIQNEMEQRCKTMIWIDPRKKRGELYWPGRISAEKTKELKSAGGMGPYAYAGQYQQNPKPEGGGIISEIGWNKWEHNEYPPFSYVVASLDPAYTEDEINDPSGFSIWGVWRDPKTRQPQVMLMYAARYHKRINDLVTTISGQCRKFRADMLLIENKASGKSVYQEMQRLFRDIGAQLVDPVGDKTSRAYAVQHLFGYEEVFDNGERKHYPGLVWCPPRLWAEMVIEELASLPKGEFDDLADSATQALKYLRITGELLTPAEGTGEDSLYGKALADSEEPIYDA